MQIRFSGVTVYSGNEQKISEKLDEAQAKDIGTLTARLDGSGGVALTGADTERFLKDNYGVEMPPEFKGKSQAEAMQMVMADQAKYQPLLEKLMDVASDVFGMIQKVFDYAEARKADGKDAEGNPVKEIEVK